MLWGWSKTKCSPIGIDFGIDRVKLIQVTLTDPPQLVAAASAELPPEARNDPAARTTFLSDTLRQLIRKGGFTGRRVICSIPASQTLVAYLQINRSESEGLSDQVAAHLRERFNVEPARLIIRHLVSEAAPGAANKQEVIVLAAGREMVRRYMDMLKGVKLDVVGMQSEPVAMLKSFEHMYRRAEDAKRTTCFIDIGAATTKLIIAHGSQLVFAKTITAAGDHLTRQHAKAHSLDFAAARQARMSMQPDVAAAAVVAPPPRRAERQLVAATSAVSASSSAGGAMAMIEAQMRAEREAAEGSESRTPSADPPLADDPVAHEPEPPESPESPEPSEPENDAVDCLIDELRLSLRHHQTVYPNRAVEKLVFLGGEANHRQTCQTIAQAVHIGAQLGDPLARLTRAASCKPPVNVDLRRPQPGWAVPLGLALSPPDC
ncbi:MAG: pilus assembly protein PilM [Phycisphaeraceae bacterium]|nr:pilus assembly protein PilM [Phycisphaeraceae bacterium]